MVVSKYLASLKASSKDGLYLSFSMAWIVCRVTPRLDANSSWVMRFIARRTRSVFSNRLSSQLGPIVVVHQGVEGLDDVGLEREEIAGLFVVS